MADGSGTAAAWTLTDWKPVAIPNVRVDPVADSSIGRRDADVPA